MSHRTTYMNILFEKYFQINIVLIIRQIIIYIKGNGIIFVFKRVENWHPLDCSIFRKHLSNINYCYREITQHVEMFYFIPYNQYTNYSFSIGDHCSVIAQCQVGACKHVLMFTKTERIYWLRLREAEIEYYFLITNVGPSDRLETT